MYFPEFDHLPRFRPLFLQSVYKLSVKLVSDKNDEVVNHLYITTQKSDDFRVSRNHVTFTKVEIRWLSRGYKSDSFDLSTTHDFHLGRNQTTFT